jgi:hypothetical protein
MVRRQTLHMKYMVLFTLHTKQVPYNHITHARTERCKIIEKLAYKHI